MIKQFLKGLKYTWLIPFAAFITFGVAYTVGVVPVLYFLAFVTGGFIAVGFIHITLFMGEVDDE